MNGTAEKMADRPAEDEALRRRRSRRVALVLALVAFSFYLAFILMGVLRS